MKSAAGGGPLGLRTEGGGSLCAAPASTRRGWRAVGDNDKEGAPRVGLGRRIPDASRGRICVGTSPGEFRESPTPLQSNEGGPKRSGPSQLENAILVRPGPGPPQRRWLRRS